MPQPRDHAEPTFAGGPEGPGAGFIVQRAHEQQVGAIELWVTDPQGQIRIVEVPREALGEVLELGFALSPELAAAWFWPPSTHAPAQSAEAGRSLELFLWPDPHTFQILPRRVGEAPTARLLCDLQRPDGSPSPLCVRSRLKETLARCASQGSALYVGATLEHRWLEGPTEPRPLRDPRRMKALASGVVAGLEALGIPWRSHAQSRRPASLGTPGADPSRWAFELDWVDPLMLADSLVTHRHLVRELAHADGVGATFMPHPWGEASRARLELFLSSLEDGVPLFADPLAEAGLSLVARGVASVLSQALPELALALRPTVNSYSRPDAPTLGAIGSGHSESGPALALAGLDACANPYLVLTLVAGLVQHATTHAHQLAPTSEPESFPETLVEAVRRATASRWMRELLGTSLVEVLGAWARSDAASWRQQVTPWEVERYL